MMHYRMVLKMPIDLKRDENSPPVWSYELTSKAGVTVAWGPSELNKGYKRMLEKAVEQMTDLFQSPEFQNSYRSIAEGQDI